MHMKAGKCLVHQKSRERIHSVGQNLEAVDQEWQPSLQGAEHSNFAFCRLERRKGVCFRKGLKSSYVLSEVLESDMSSLPKPLHSRYLLCCPMSFAAQLQVLDTHRAEYLRDRSWSPCGLRRSRTTQVYRTTWVLVAPETCKRFCPHTLFKDWDDLLHPVQRSMRSFRPRLLKAYCLLVSLDNQVSVLEAA